MMITSDLLLSRSRPTLSTKKKSEISDDIKAINFTEITFVSNFVG